MLTQVDIGAASASPKFYVISNTSTSASLAIAQYVDVLGWA